MNYFFILFLLFFNGAARGQSSQMHDVAVKALHYSPVNIIMLIIGTENEAIAACVNTIKKDVEFEGQFALNYQYRERIPTRAEIQSFAKNNYPVAVFIQEEVSRDMRHCINVYVYDTNQLSMITGKRHMKAGTSARGWGHQIAELLVECLMGSPIAFSSRIAYCKDVHVPGKRAVRYIYIADMIDFQETSDLVVSRPTLNIAPRWNRDSLKPLLFYSEGTSRNFRLMVNDLKGNARVAVSMDGITMQPAFSGDGQLVVFCSSRGAGSSQLYAYDRRQKLRRLTNHDGNSLAPTIKGDGSCIFFCSDHEGRSPAIYAYNVDKGTCERITHGGMAFSPHYCDANGQLVYAQSVHGILQLFIYNDLTKQHRQLTFDLDHKEECSWSPCGSYIVYSSVKDGKGRIALLNVATGKTRYLTSKNDDCSYPIWSPRYTHYLVVI